MARRLLCPAATPRRWKEPVMKKMFKVISAVEDKEGKTKFWMRLGTAFLNRDNSINVLLDAFPKSMQLQIREFDENELNGGADRDGPRRGVKRTGDLPLPMPHLEPSTSADVPF
jgi:hypothetical protein